MSSGQRAYEDEIKVGMKVRMNPFRIEAANNHCCILFSGEEKIDYINDVDYDIPLLKVSNSNNWRRENLLIKGIDYM